jgi:hypothetical protein
LHVGFKGPPVHPTGGLFHDKDVSGKSRAFPTIRANSVSRQKVNALKMPEKQAFLSNPAVLRVKHVYFSRMTLLRLIATHPAT